MKVGTLPLIEREGMMKKRLISFFSAIGDPLQDGNNLHKGAVLCV